MAAFIMEVQVAFAKKTTVFDKIKLFATQTVKGVRNPRSSRSSLS
jgi:hypothetical protein